VYHRKSRKLARRNVDTSWRVAPLERPVARIFSTPLSNMVRAAAAVLACDGLHVALPAGISSTANCAPELGSVRQLVRLPLLLSPAIAPLGGEAQYCQMLVLRSSW
jgi:hypothetical protein